MSPNAQLLTNETGKRTAVLLPISDYENLFEDLEDLAAVSEHRIEPTIPHEQFLEEMKRDGLFMD